ncbi:hypothetical protein E2C01_087621 [Portunus trituberculatus]|uniref:Uncharacterized protein n=1 Tax=Portunus trituberculatus TaxID=210409 RepID=A0A5B7JHS4_PORTR|nr:hypothetical protein [Portunus trituberculatus]
MKYNSKVLFEAEDDDIPTSNEPEPAPGRNYNRQRPHNQDINQQHRSVRPAIHYSIQSIIK